MKIVYIGEFTKIHNEEGNARALERLGVSVIRLQEGDLKTIDQIPDCDYLFFAKLKVEPFFRMEIVKWAKEKGIKTVCWNWDLYFGLPRERELPNDAIFRADYVFSPDGGSDFSKYGVNHKLVRQGIAKEEAHRGKKIEAPEIIFVGARNHLYPYRTKLLAYLNQEYKDKFKLIGELKEVRGEDLNDLYESAKIVIGDSVYSDKYWSNRIYNTIGRGGFIIHPMIEDLEKDYTPYKHFIPYNIGDFEGLKQKIDYYLTHDKERDKIRLTGFKHTLKNHLIDNRIKCILDYIQQKK